MEKEKELEINKLDDVSGGGGLEKYLKTLAGKDKNKILVDYGTGTELELDPSIKSDDAGNLEVIMRDKSDPEIDAELKL